MPLTFDDALHRLAAAVVALGLGLCASCGGKARQAASAPDAGADARAGACGSVPLPKEHRALAQTCPAERGRMGPFDTTACVNRSGIACTSDADCTAGKNGRCELNGDPCQTTCTYDACMMDADCAEGPCICRSSGTDFIWNYCVPGSTCRTDADCGGCEYCSPSAVPNSLNCDGVASVVYACHTANDECTNEGDCGEGGITYCGYDAGARLWGCGFCVPFPHP